MKKSPFYIIGLRQDSGRDELWDLSGDVSQLPSPPYIIGNGAFLEEMFGYNDTYYREVAEKLILAIDNNNFKGISGKEKKKILKKCDESAKKMGYPNYYQDNANSLIVYNILL